MQRGKTRGTRLREERRRRYLSLRAVAEQVGVSFNTLSRIERGANCTATAADAIDEWLEDAGKAWGYAIVVTALIEGPLEDDPEAAKAMLREMEAAGPSGAQVVQVHGHFERVQDKPDMRETMGQ